MKKTHDFVDKSTAPIQGNIYDVFLNEINVYKAEITQYKKGACWATITVIQPSNDEMSKVYKTGDVFEVKVTHYTFTPAND